MITDTTLNPRFDWLYGQAPSEIEAQERKGQKELEQAQQLPRRTARGDAAENYNRMGIDVIEGNDPIFITVRLPHKWRIVPTNHSMWSDLVDNKNRKRARIFYKAAFYDRSSHIVLLTRFDVTFDQERTDSYDPYIIGTLPSVGRVLDGGKTVFETIPRPFTMTYSDKTKSEWWAAYGVYRSKILAQCRRWLNARYPNWDSPFTYW